MAAFRNKLRRSVKKVLERISGEYSSEAPDAIEKFKRNLGEDQDRQTVKARVERPKTRE